jgi:hypothetical protein
MHCPFCNRKPNQISEYVQQANKEEMSPHEYVRMDEGTYHLQTDLFCCTGCYVALRFPLKTELIQAYTDYRNKVIPLRG